MRKYNILVILVLLSILSACRKESRCNSYELVNEADIILSTGGLEDPGLRSKAKKLYDSALNCEDSLSDSEDELVISHARFGLAMINIFESSYLLNIILGSMSGEGTACGAGCAGPVCGLTGCPSLCGTGGMSCSNCSDSCNISIGSQSAMRNIRDRLILTGFLNGLVYLSPLLFLLLFRLHRAIRHRKERSVAMVIILLLLSSMLFTGLAPWQNEGQCQPFESGGVEKFAGDTVHKIFSPIIDDLRIVIDYESFSMDIMSARLTMFTDNPLTSAKDDIVYMNFSGKYDKGDVSIILGIFESMMGMLKFIFSYEKILSGIINMLTAPDCSTLPYLDPEFGILSDMESLEVSRAYLSSAFCT